MLLRGIPRKVTRGKAAEELQKTSFVEITVLADATVGDTGREHHGGAGEFGRNLGSDVRQYEVESYGQQGQGGATARCARCSICQVLQCLYP